MEGPSETTVEVTSSEKEGYDEFLGYINSIEQELSKKGSRINQSIIIGYLAEVMAENLLDLKGVKDSRKKGNYRISKIVGKPRELSDEIIKTKHPYYFEAMQKIETESISDNPLIVIGRRINNKINTWFTARRGSKLLNFTNRLNTLFFTLLVFVGLQSLYPLLRLFSSSDNVVESFKILGGETILLNQLWTPLLMIGIAGGALVISSITFYSVTLYHVRLGIADYRNWLQKLLKFNLINFINSIFFSTYLLLGAISKINDVRINGYEPGADLLAPTSALLITTAGIVFFTYRKINSIPPSDQGTRVLLQSEYSWQVKTVVYSNYLLGIAFLGVFVNTARIIILNLLSSDLFIVVHPSYLTVSLLFDPIITVLSFYLIFIYYADREKNSIKPKLKRPLFIQFIFTLIFFPLILFNYFQYNLGIEFVYGATYFEYSPIYISIVKYSIMKLVFAIFYYRLVKTNEDSP